MMKMNEKKIVLVLSDGKSASLAARKQFLLEEKIRKSINNKISIIDFEFASCLTHESQELNDSEKILTSFTDQSCELEKVYVFTHSQIVFSFFRVMVKEHKLPPNQFEILWFETDDLREEEKTRSFVLEVDKDGRLPYWPNELFKIQEDLLSRML